MAILKPNKPLKYVKPDGTTQSEYPLTSIDQVIDEDGIHRLNQTIVRADLSDVEEGQVVLTNADLLDNHPASYFATSEGLGTKANKSDVKDLQNKTRINYLRPTLQTQTVNGVTITNNGDGTYTVNGTVSDNELFDIGTVYLKKGTYKINGRPNNYGGFVWIGTSNRNMDVLNAAINENGATFTITNDCMLYVTFVFGQNTYNNAVIKPMITDDLNATYDDFVSYDDSLVTGINSGLKMDLLWTNASPTSSFGGQNISIDISKYYFIYVVCNYRMDISINKSSVFIKCGNNNAVSFILPNLVNRNIITNVGERYINFTDCYYSSSYGSEAVDNSYIIPYQIYGVL